MTISTRQSIIRCSKCKWLYHQQENCECRRLEWVPSCNHSAALAEED